MKNLEDKIVNAQFRSKMIEEYNSDPGENWEKLGLFENIIYLFVVYAVFKTFVPF